MSRPTVMLNFEGGPYDGVAIEWTADAAACPTAFTFEDHYFDRSIEPGMTCDEVAATCAARTYLGARAHRYELDGMLCPLEGAEQWTYTHRGGGPIAHHEDGM